MRTAALFLLPGVVLGCDSNEALPCDGPSFMVFVPVERAPDVADATISGDLCANQHIECSSRTDDGGCLEWWITPIETEAESGQCQVEFTFECGLPPEQIPISWVRHHGGDCDGLLHAEPRAHSLEGTTCAELAAGGGGGAPAAGGAGTPAGGAGNAGAAGSS